MKKSPAEMVVLGLGNPILRDDAVGIRVAQMVRRYLSGKKDVDVKDASVGGLKVLDELTGYRRAIIIDSIRTEGGKPGQLYRMTPDDLQKTEHLSSPHDVNFIGALEMGRKQEMDIPEDIIIIAVEIKDNTTFGEEMTPDVEAAIPRVVEEVLKEVGRV